MIRKKTKVYSKKWKELIKVITNEKFENKKKRRIYITEWSIWKENIDLFPLLPRMSFIKQMHQKCSFAVMITSVVTQ